MRPIEINIYSLSKII